MPQVKTRREDVDDKRERAYESLKELSEAQGRTAAAAKIWRDSGHHKYSDESFAFQDAQEKESDTKEEALRCCMDWYRMEAVYRRERGRG